MKKKTVIEKRFGLNLGFSSPRQGEREKRGRLDFEPSENVKKVLSGER